MTAEVLALGENIRKKEGNRTFIRIESNKIPLQSFTTIIKNNYFDRNYVVVSQIEDFADERTYNYINPNGRIFRTGSGENTVVPLQYHSTDAIFWIIEDGANRPLEITEITGNYQSDKLLFLCEDPNEMYRITYGNENLSKPTYDIERYYKDLKENEIDLVTLEEVEKQEEEISEEEKMAAIAAQKSKERKNVIYKIFLGILSVALIIYAAQSMGKKKK
jgi:hypothetical protein